MAETTTVPSKPKNTSKPKPEPKYASAADLAELSKGMSDLVGIVGELAEKLKSPPAPKSADEVKHDAEVTKAKPNLETVNPAWVEKAQELIGEALDHCEVFYPKHGGTLFTLVIKKEFSNAPVDYLERYKSDRRTREIGNEGIEGVENYCKLVAANLKRSK